MFYIDQMFQCIIIGIQSSIVSKFRESFIILLMLSSLMVIKPMYAQIYILDTAEQLNVRRANNNKLDPVVIDNLQMMLLDSYPYISHCCHAYKLIKEKPADEQQKITIRLHVHLQQDQRTHNLPTAEEIAVIIPEERVHHALDNRDVVLQARGE